MRKFLTDPEWAVRWLTAASSDQWANGKPIRAYGKDANGYLVAVRTEDGTFGVDNLPAVLANGK